MSRPGDVYDNAAMESFFASYKLECVPNKGFATRQQAWQETFEYIEMFYNRQRSWAISPLQTRCWCILTTSPLNRVQSRDHHAARCHRLPRSLTGWLAGRQA